MLKTNYILSFLSVFRNGQFSIEFAKVYTNLHVGFKFPQNCKKKLGCNTNIPF